MKWIFRTAGFAWFSLCFVVASAQRPNIIYILADDLGYGDVSVLNPDSRIQTPAIDALAKQGMVFTDAHSNSAVCSPTRYGILTGRYAWRTKLQQGVLWSYDIPLIDSARLTVASLLKGGGYNTACIGKWHLGLQWQKDGEGKTDFRQPVYGGPRALGFDYFYGITASLDIPPYVYIENEKITASTVGTIAASGGKAFWREGPLGNDFKHEEVLPVLTSKAVSYIEQQAQIKKPFFLFLSLPSPHTPILPTGRFVGKSSTNAYGDFVAMTDDVVAQVMQALRQSGIAENTLVVFTSDNGCSPSANFAELKAKGHYPSAGFRGAKADIYEGGHRVPFIASWPKTIKAGNFSHETVCLTDLMATCAELVNQRLPENAGEDSYSLLPLFRQEAAYARKATIHHSIDGCFAIREGQWKLALSRGSGGWSSPTEKEAKAQQLPEVQLFDLLEDKAEQVNVAGKYPEVVARLKAHLEEIVGAGRSTPGSRQENDVPVSIRK
jgi:arylsulfatase A-like enzyme